MDFVDVFLSVAVVVAKALLFIYLIIYFFIYYIQNGATITLRMLRNPGNGDVSRRRQISAFV